MTPPTPTAPPLDPREIERTLEPVERAHMLPPRAFVDDEVFEWERANLFRSWICVGHVSAVDEPGKFVMRELGPDSVVVIGAEDGRPRAFLNVCRHRGARIVEEAEGKVRKRLRCPYHAWSYGLDGSLQAAPHMDGIEDFDRSCWGLMPVRLAVVGGLVLVDLSGEAADADEHVGDLAGAPRALPERVARARRRALLRGRRELEGDRRELQRVPALPRRPPGAERAQRLHERRGRAAARAPGAAAR